MPKIHKFPFAIAYADTDAGGIVYHGRYIEIAERARMDLQQKSIRGDERYTKLGVALSEPSDIIENVIDMCFVQSIQRGRAIYNHLRFGK